MNNIKIIKKSKLPSIYKSKKLNNAIFEDFTLNEYRVFLHLLSKVKKINYEEGKLQREHKLKASEFSQMFETSLCNCYSILKSTADKLVKRNLKIENRYLKQTSKINICSRADYDETKGLIMVKFTDD